MTALKSHRPYLLLLSGLLAAGILLVGLVNLLVDPYGIYGLVDKPGNAIKPHAGSHGAMAKAYQVQRVKPRTLVLGNSRAEVGFNPESAAWPQAAQPVYNLALPGTGPLTSLRYLEHAVVVQKPALIVLGVDFMDFLVQPDAGFYQVDGAPLPMERRLLVTRTGRPNARYLKQRVEDFAATVVSLDAFLHSIATLHAQSAPYPAHLTPRGFNPMRDYEGIARHEGYSAMFRQRDQENARAYLRRPKNLFVEGQADSPQFELLRRMIRLSQEQGAELKVVIYPYHAHLLEILQEAELWPMFETWKRTLARTIDEANRGRDGPAVQLWDFSGYNAFSAEPVPGPGDRTSATRWYWEAGHFKQALGDVLLQQMFAEPGRFADTAIGLKLVPDNVEQALQRIRQERVWYQAAYGREARMMRDLVEQARKSP